jgi:NAD(P)-dependent dehydrogenase (short-subunit alcohol dehydrogenase family)
MSHILVTGAARGLGLEMTRQLLDAGHTVVACPRRAESCGLDAFSVVHKDRLHVVPMDVADGLSVREAAHRVAAKVPHVDVLINNAGVLPKGEPSVDALDFENLERAYRVNAVGPLRVTAAFLPLLQKGSGKRVVNITSLMGSIEDNGSGGSYSYRMSKAALNIATKNLAIELGDEGFVVVVMHPGWVRTRMGGDGAPLEIEAAVRDLLGTALGAGPEKNGGFFGPGGKRLPW